MNIGAFEIILIIGVLLGLIMPIGLAIVAAIMFKSQGKDNFKKCSFCAEMIQAEANICRYCGRDLVK